ncbi:MAG: hypothetical protein ACRENG_03145 [bacterium]
MMPAPEKILILTPVKDAVAHLEAYFKNLDQLAHPHEAISLGFLEGDSRDETYAVLRQKLPELNCKFRRAGLWKKDFGFKMPAGLPRWAAKIQVERRTILAKSRNHLLFHALDDEDWVLWLDVDVIEYPADIIEKLLATGKDIVHPHCVVEYHGRSYDLNAWRDRGKYFLHDLRHKGDLVKLHSVGGTMLLIRADRHRDGLIFPPFLYGVKNKLIRRVNLFHATRREMIAGFAGILMRFIKGKYRGEIETDGLGMMAHDMGITCWGMPNLEIKHRYQKIKGN